MHTAYFGIHVPVERALLSAIPPVRFRSFLWTMSVDFSCGECGKEVTDDDKSIQYESDCMCWFHADYVNLSDNDYNELSKTDTICEGNQSVCNSVTNIS